VEGASYEWRADTGRAAEQIRFMLGDGAGDPGRATATPVAFSDGTRHRIDWTPSAGAAFTPADRGRLELLARHMAPALEILTQRETAATLLETYLGRRSGRRVLAGEIRRGSGETIDAVIWMSDLRGFTGLSETLPQDVLIGLLNAHFERLAAPIKAFVGEVLKFIGDGLLAVFPIDDFGPTRACGQALSALASARRAMALLDEGHAARGLPALPFGVALHRGAVIYGNIGAPDRLDFTVIGPAVNAASRIEQLCKVLACPVLASAGFAEVSPQPLVPLGRHALRGIGEPVEVFTLPELAGATG
jgi:class 3 adenylate cyclase